MYLSFEFAICFDYCSNLTMLLDQRLFVDLKNSTITSSSDPALRIVVRSDVRPPMKCIENINLLNAVINALKVPIVLDFEQTYGRRVGYQWTGDVGNLFNNLSDVWIGLFAVTSERFQAVRMSTTFWFGGSSEIIYSSISRKNYFTYGLTNSFYLEIQFYQVF